MPAAKPPKYPVRPPEPPLEEWMSDPRLFPDLDSFIIDDGQPVDGVYTEKQMRLLTEPLHSGWEGPASGEPFVVMSNVGVFRGKGIPPIVPDIFFALGVEQGNDLSQKANCSYFIWLRGKSPDVAFEVVSNDEGGEDTRKMKEYASLRVPYYVIFDPEGYLYPVRLRMRHCEYGCG